MFLGLSKGGVVNKEMIMSMAKRPIVFGKRQNLRFHIKKQWSVEMI